jgi:uncharacterized protein YyaL (SSP411 family)
MKRIRFLVLTECLITMLIIGCAQKPGPAGIVWMTELETAIQKSRLENKPMMIDFMAPWCPPCNAMEDSTFNQPAVVTKALQFVTVRIDVDKQPDIANAYKCNARKYGGIGIPNLLFLAPDQRTLAHPIGYLTPAHLTAVMDSVLAAVQTGQ